MSRHFSDKPNTEFLLVAQGDQIVKVYPHYTGSLPEHTLFLKQGSEISTLDYHWEQGMVYFYDDDMGYIYRMSFKEKE